MKMYSKNPNHTNAKRHSEHSEESLSLASQTLPLRIRSGLKAFSAQGDSFEMIYKDLNQRLTIVITLPVCLLFVMRQGRALYGIALRLYGVMLFTGKCMLPVPQVRCMMGLHRMGQKTTRPSSSFTRPTAGRINCRILRHTMNRAQRLVLLFGTGVFWQTLRRRDSQIFSNFRYITGCFQPLVSTDRSSSTLIHSVELIICH